MKKAVQKCAAFFFGFRTATGTCNAKPWFWAIKGGKAETVAPASTPRIS